MVINMDFWKEYSSIEDGDVTMYINSETGEWAIFVKGKFYKTGTAGQVPNAWLHDYNDFFSP